MTYNSDDMSPSSYIDQIKTNQNHQFSSAIGGNFSRLFPDIDINYSDANETISAMGGKYPAHLANMQRVINSNFEGKEDAYYSFLSNSQKKGGRNLFLEFDEENSEDSLFKGYNIEDDVDEEEEFKNTFNDYLWYGKEPKRKSHFGKRGENLNVSSRRIYQGRNNSQRKNGKKDGKINLGKCDQLNKSNTKRSKEKQIINEERRNGMNKRRRSSRQSEFERRVKEKKILNHSRKIPKEVLRKYENEIDDKNYFRKNVIKNNDSINEKLYWKMLVQGGKGRDERAAEREKRKNNNNIDNDSNDKNLTLKESSENNNIINEKKNISLESSSHIEKKKEKKTVNPKKTVVIIEISDSDDDNIRAGMLLRRHIRYYPKKNKDSKDLFGGNCGTSNDSNIVNGDDDNNNNKDDVGNDNDKNFSETKKIEEKTKTGHIKRRGRKKKNALIHMKELNQTLNEKGSDASIEPKESNVADKLVLFDSIPTNDPLSVTSASVDDGSTPVSPETTAVAFSKDVSLSSNLKSSSSNQNASIPADTSSCSDLSSSFSSSNIHQPECTPPINEICASTAPNNSSTSLSSSSSLVPSFIFKNTSLSPSSFDSVDNFDSNMNPNSDVETFSLSHQNNSAVQTSGLVSSLPIANKVSYDGFISLPMINDILSLPTFPPVSPPPLPLLTTENICLVNFSLFMFKPPLLRFKIKKRGRRKSQIEESSEITNEGLLIKKKKRHKEVLNLGQWFHWDKKKREGEMIGEEEEEIGRRKRLRVEEENNNNNNSEDEKEKSKEKEKRKERLKIYENKGKKERRSERVMRLHEMKEKEKFEKKRMCFLKNRKLLMESKKAETYLKNEEIKKENEKNYSEFQKLRLEFFGGNENNNNINNNNNSVNDNINTNACEGRSKQVKNGVIEKVVLDVGKLKEISSRMGSILESWKKTEEEHGKTEKMRERSENERKENEIERGRKEKERQMGEDLRLKREMALNFFESERQKSEGQRSKREKEREQKSWEYEWKKEIERRVDQEKMEMMEKLIENQNSQILFLREEMDNLKKENENSEYLKKNEEIIEEKEENEENNSEKREKESTVTLRMEVDELNKKIVKLMEDKSEDEKKINELEKELRRIKEEFKLETEK